MKSQNTFQKWLPVLFGIILGGLIATGVFFWFQGGSPSSAPTGIASTTAAPFPSASPSASPQISPSSMPSPAPSVSPSPLISPVAMALGSPTPTGKVDLSVDSNGMSKATVVMNTTEGTVKFKLYPQDAPITVNRFVDLVQHGFYNGLIFHRAIPGFLVQTGDPTGTGNGGSGQKLPAEFNNRHHIEGTVAMARAPQDPNSADSQFYITLSPQPRLDHNYTIFGQVIEGMDVVRKIKVGDKISSMTIQ